MKAFLQKGLNNREINLEYRDDIFFKLPLARDLLCGKTNQGNIDLYLDHLAKWNGFTEASPKKRGPQDFLDAFKSLSGFAKQESHPAFHEPIDLSRNSVPLNGSHRMSLAIACEQLEITPPSLSFRPTDSESPPWNLGHFVTLGVDSAYVRLALLERMAARPSSALVIWPCAQKYRDRILKEFSVLPSPGIAFHFTLDQPETAGLVLATYLDEQWASQDDAIQGKTQEVGRSGQVTVVPLYTDNQESLGTAKSKCRTIWDNEFQGIHTTDSTVEALRLLRVVSHDASLALLGHIDLAGARYFRDQVLRPLESGGPYFSGQIAITGSQILGPLGMRTPADIDYITESDLKFHEGNDHRDHLVSLGIDLNDFTRQDENWVYLFGVKTLSLEGYQTVISQRREPKDIQAMRMIQKHPLRWGNRRFSATVGYRHVTAGFRLIPPILQSKPAQKTPRFLALYWATARTRLALRKFKAKSLRIVAPAKRLVTAKAQRLLTRLASFAGSKSSR